MNKGKNMKQNINFITETITASDLIWKKKIHFIAFFSKIGKCPFIKYMKKWAEANGLTQRFTPGTGLTPHSGVLEMCSYFTIHNCSACQHRRNSVDTFVIPFRTWLETKAIINTEYVLCNTLRLCWLATKKKY